MINMEFVYSGKLKNGFLRKMRTAYVSYTNAAAARNKILEVNNMFYAMKQARFVSGENDEGGLKFDMSSGYTFNAIANKHADFMDNYPVPNFLSRRMEDEEIASLLTKVLPHKLDRIGYKTTFDDCAWDKLIDGTSVQHIYYDSDIQSARADKVDIFNFAWQPDIKNIQDSRYLFYTSLVHIDDLKEQYPEYADYLVAASHIKKRSETSDDTETSEPGEFAEVVNCYYKKRVKVTDIEYGDRFAISEDGVEYIEEYEMSRTETWRNEVHLVKFNGNVILASSEDNDEEIFASLKGATETVDISGGIYEHGQYPFVVDVLYPNRDGVTGFGIVDITSAQQLYIDKMKQIITKNALMSSKTRFAYRKNSGLNEKNLTDMEVDAFEVIGDVREAFREISTEPIAPFVVQLHDAFVAELKEVAGNRDFQQGGTSGGVTAFGAIYALQQAGEKLSRDMIQRSYEAYKQVVELLVSVIGQFEDTDDSYRISGTYGEAQYVVFSGLRLYDYEAGKPIMLDIKVVPQVKNPFNKEANNQLVMTLYGQGFFNPANAEPALLALESMDFEGRDKIMAALQEKQERILEQQQMQMYAVQSQPQTVGGYGGETPDIESILSGEYGSPTPNRPQGMYHDYGLAGIEDLGDGTYLV